MEEQVEEPADATEDKLSDEELTADLNDWFDVMYGDEYGPEWYPDVTDLRIVSVGEKVILAIETANTNDGVPSAMAMLIWGYNDSLITNVNVYDLEGNLVFDISK